jgi:hypothetical protein
MPDLDTDPAGVELAGQLARSHVLARRDDEAIAWSDRTLAGARAAGSQAVAIDALITRGTARIRRGDDEGRADLRAAIDESQQAGLVRAELRARNNLAWLSVTDDPHGAMAAARDGLALATRMGVGDMELQLADVAVAVALDTGDWDWALQTLDDLRGRPQAPAHRVAFAANEAALRALRGDGEAERVLRDVEPLDIDTDRQVVAGMDMARAWMAFCASRFDDARRLALAAAEASLGADRHAALVLAGHGAIWQRDAKGVAGVLRELRDAPRSGRAIRAALATLEAGHAALAGRDEAAEQYDRAVAAWRDVRLPLHLALCLVEQDRCLTSDGHGGRATAEAMSILHGLGAAGLAVAVTPPTGASAGPRGV